MLSDDHAVEPDGGTELSLVDAQDGPAGPGGELGLDLESAAVPEVIAGLVRDADGGGALRLGPQFVADLDLDQLAAIELIHVGEGRRGEIGQAGHWRGVGELGGRWRGGDAVGHVPASIE